MTVETVAWRDLANGQLSLYSSGPHYQALVSRDDYEAAEARAQQLAAERDEAQMDAAISGTETGQYWRGNDDACKGVMMRWREAMTKPIPSPGVLGDETMEQLYRDTESLRTRAQQAEQALRELVVAQEARLIAAARSGIGETGGLMDTIDRLDAAWAAVRAIVESQRVSES